MRDRPDDDELAWAVMHWTLPPSEHLPVFLVAGDTFNGQSVPCAGWVGEDGWHPLVKGTTMMLPTTPDALMQEMQALHERLLQTPIGSDGWIPVVAEQIHTQVPHLSLLSICVLVETYLQVHPDSAPPPPDQWIPLLPENDPVVIPGMRLYLRRGIMPGMERLESEIAAYVAALRS